MTWIDLNRNTSVLVAAESKATGTQISTLYNKGEQKSISECIICPTNKQQTKCDSETDLVFDKENFDLTS